MKELEAAAQPQGVELQRREVRVPEDSAGAFAAATRQRAGVLVPDVPIRSRADGCMIVLSVLDRIVIALTWLEYRRLKRIRGGN